MPEKPPLLRRRKTEVPPVSTKEPVVSPSSLRSTPDGDAIDPANCACAAAGPVYEEKARFEVPAPPDVAPATRTLSPPPAMPAAAAAGPEYDDTKRFPKDDVWCVQSKPEHKKETTSDADRKQRNDAAMQQKDRIGEKRETGESESVPKRYKTYPREQAPPPPRELPIIEFIPDEYYNHERHGDVKFLYSQKDDRGKLMCCVRTWNERKGVFKEIWVSDKDLKVHNRPTGAKSATGVAASGANNTAFRRPA